MKTLIASVLALTMLGASTANAYPYGYRDGPGFYHHHHHHWRCFRHHRRWC